MNLFRCRPIWAHFRLLPAEVVEHVVPLKAAYWGFIAIGLALPVAGYRWERKYLQGNE